MTTTLEPSFLRAVVLMSSFRGHAMRSAQAGLLYIGLRCDTFTASDLPGELTNGSRHIAGAATGALVAQGLLEVVGRVKSSRPEANGRKIDILRIPQGKRATVYTWLAANGFSAGQAEQQSLELTA